METEKSYFEIVVAVDLYSADIVAVAAHSLEMLLQGAAAAAALVKSRSDMQSEEVAAAERPAEGLVPAAKQVDMRFDAAAAHSADSQLATAADQFAMQSAVAAEFAARWLESCCSSSMPCSEPYSAAYSPLAGDEQELAVSEP